MPRKPVEVYGKLEYVGQDAEGKIHLIIRKTSNPQTTRQIIKDMKQLEKKDIRLILKLLSWNTHVLPQTP